MVFRFFHATNLTHTSNCPSAIGRQSSAASSSSPPAIAAPASPSLYRLWGAVTIPFPRIHCAVIFKCKTLNTPRTDCYGVAQDYLGGHSRTSGSIPSPFYDVTWSLCGTNALAICEHTIHRQRNIFYFHGVTYFVRVFGFVHRVKAGALAGCLHPNWHHRSLFPGISTRH